MNHLLQVPVRHIGIGITRGDGFTLLGDPQAAANRAWRWTRRVTIHLHGYTLDSWTAEELHLGQFLALVSADGRQQAAV